MALFWHHRIHRPGLNARLVQRHHKHAQYIACVRTLIKSLGLRTAGIKRDRLGHITDPLLVFTEVKQLSSDQAMTNIIAVHQ